jgi:multiple sugar transport system substrate-binding protein
MPPANIYPNSNVPNQIANPDVAKTSPPTTPFQVASPPKKKPLKIVLIVSGVILLVLIILVIFRLFGAKVGGNSGNVTWWGLWEDPNIVSPLISAYETSHPGVKITYVAQSHQDYRERLSNAFAKGEGPDIFSFHNSWVPMFKSELDALPSSLMTAADFSKNYYQVITSDMSYGNSIVGIPVGYDALTLYINEDIFGKAGKTPPTTWDDLRSLAKALTIKDDKGAIVQSGISLGRTENVDHWQEILALLMIQNGVDLSRPIGKNAEDALKFFTLFSSIDGVWDSTLPTSTQAFAAGKLAMYIAPSWRYFEIVQKNPDLKFKTVPIPQLPKDNPNEQDVTYATYWAQGVWSKSPSKSAAWGFLNFLSSTDSMQKLYQNESAVRAFGEPYPRSDMATLLKDHPIVGSIISQAPGSRSWFLASRTFDGATGINTQLSNYFGDAINAVATGKKSAQDALTTVAQGVAQVLIQYGISVR